MEVVIRIDQFEDRFRRDIGKDTKDEGVVQGPPILVEDDIQGFFRTGLSGIVIHSKAVFHVADIHHIVVRLVVTGPTG
jgi:hypothetical protein